MLHKIDEINDGCAQAEEARRVGREDAEEIVGEIQRLGLGDDVAASLAGDWPLGDGRDDEQGEECRQNAVRAARIGLWTQ
jgi:hypothetical protein